MREHDKLFTTAPHQLFALCSLTMVDVAAPIIGILAAAGKVAETLNPNGHQFLRTSTNMLLLF
jgi:hypothetical protein